MVEAVGGPQSTSVVDHLVLLDQFTQRPVQTVMIQGGGARSVVFPVLDLVKKWIHSPRLNHGVYIRLQSNNPVFVNGMNASAGIERHNQPLLVVQTQTKPQKVDKLFISLR